MQAEILNREMTVQLRARINQLVQIISKTTPNFLEFQQCLPFILALKDSDQALCSVFNAHSLVDQSFDRPFFNTLLHVLPMLVEVCLAEFRVCHNETAHSEALRNNGVKIFDRVRSAREIGNHTTSNDAAEIVH